MSQYAINTTRPSERHSALNLLDEGAANAKITTRLNAAVTIYIATEFLAVTSSAYFIDYLYYGFFLKSWQTEPKNIIAPILIAVLVLLTSLAFRSFVEIRSQPRYIFLWKSIKAIAIAFTIFLSIIFAAKYSDQYSRATFIFQIFGIGITVTCLRAFFHSWLLAAIASNKIEAQRAVLIGNIPHCETLADGLKDSGVRTIGLFHLPQCRDMNSETTNQKFQEIISGCRSLQPDDIFITENAETMPAMLNLASALMELPARIHVIPIRTPEEPCAKCAWILANSNIIEFGNLQTIMINGPPLSISDLCIKRAFDLILATVGLIVLSPLFMLVSIGIKFDSRGPIFFRQRRHGFNNREIRVFKFRSMTTLEDGDQVKQVIEKDMRVTFFGHILRKYNIDELLQLLNVLRGDMSIVGPRPHPTALNDVFEQRIRALSRRHNVKPGITGWAQINGLRGATDTLEKMQRRIEYDFYYLDNWSFLFDLKIIAMTVFSKQAYLNAF
jgi:Undecaprenyl-phosphate glucose phosphotransferase